MKNQEIVHVDELKKLELLYIENDFELNSQDRLIMESWLTGTQLKNEKLENFNIIYKFGADVDLEETFNLFKQYDNILLCTCFVGDSNYMFGNFIKLCKEHGIKNKKIFNCYDKDMLSYSVLFLKNEIQKLDEENNISLYVIPSEGNFQSFVKINSELA